VKLKNHLVGTAPDGSLIIHPPEQLAGHHLFNGKSGAGKTNAMRGALNVIGQSDSPVVLLDDGKTLYEDACSNRVNLIERLDARGEADPQERWKAQYERRRFKPVIFNSMNYTGIGFDLTKLRQTKDPSGDTRLETPKERADAIFSCLVQQRGDAVLDMNIVAKTAHHVLVLVVAAHLPVSFLFRALNPYDGAGHALLVDRVRAMGHAADPNVVEALGYFQSLTTSTNYWHTNVDTTTHLFGFIRENIDFFEHDTFCYEDFHRDGGHLYVKFQHPDTRANQLMWRFLLGLWSATATQQELGRPSFLFADDPVRNIDPDIFVEHIARLRNYQVYAYISLHNLAQVGAAAATLLSLMHEIVLFRPVKVEDAETFIYALTRADIATKFLPSLTKSWGTTISDSETDGVAHVRGSNSGSSRRAAVGPMETGKRISTMYQDEEGKWHSEEKSVHTRDLTPYVPDVETSISGTSESVAVKHDVTHGIARQEGLSFTMLRVPIQEQITAEVKALCQLPKHTAWLLSDRREPVLAKLFPHRSDVEEHPDRIARARAFFAALHAANIKERAPITPAELWFPTFPRSQKVEKSGFQPPATGTGGGVPDDSGFLR
jgi:hypothetical protein